jgi:molybdate transport system regulatory protein
MLKPQSRTRVDFSESCSIGPGKISLLEGIGRTGSLSAAARELAMSYRRGWLLLHSINESFGEPVVELSIGGRDGGGAKLTAFGRQLVSDYRRFEIAVDQLAAKTFAGVKTARAPAKEVAAPRRPVSRSLAPAPAGGRKRK